MPHAHPRRASRRVVLEFVPRRDAAQRLSLAFTLLACGLPAPSQLPATSGLSGQPIGLSAGPCDEEGPR